MNKKQRLIKKRSQIANSKFKKYRRRKQYKKVNKLIAYLFQFSKHQKIATIIKEHTIQMISHQCSYTKIQEVFGTPVSIDFSNNQTKIIFHKS